MNVIEYRRIVLKASLDSVAESIENWCPSGKILKTRIVEEPDGFNKALLHEHELPIVECHTDTSYLLITTERIFSRYAAEDFRVARLEDVDRIVSTNATRGRTDQIIELGSLKEVEFLKFDGSKITFFIEHPYASYFATILIYNLITYKRHGRLYLNPTGSR